MLSALVCSVGCAGSLARTLLVFAETAPIGLEWDPSGAIQTPVCGEWGAAGLSIIVESKVQTSLSCLSGSLPWNGMVPVLLDGITQKWHSGPMPHCAQSSECPGQMGVLQAQHVCVWRRQYMRGLLA